MKKLATDLVGQRCAIVSRTTGKIDARGVIRGLAINRKGSWDGRWLFLIEDEQPPPAVYSATNVLTGKTLETPTDLAMFRPLREVGSSDESWEVLVEEKQS